MSDLHPHWRQTGEHKGSPEAAQGMRIPVRSQTVPRAPAAVVGILAVAIAGVTFFHGWENLLGQTGPGTTASSSSAPSAAALSFHVTSTGMAPLTMIAKPGDTVTITNDDTIPHIFASSTLRNGSGKLLLNPALFPGSSFSFQVYPGEVAGDFIVVSAASPSVSATITILPPSSGTSSTGNPFGGLDDVPLPSGMGPGINTGGNTSVAAASSSSTPGTVVATASSASSANSVVIVRPSSASSAKSVATTQVNASSAPATQQTGTMTGNSSSAVIPADTLVGGIAINPYTVAALAGTKMPQSTSKPATTTPLHSGANARAPREPNSGPEIWIAALCSLCGLVLLTRNQWKGLRVL